MTGAGLRSRWPRWPVTLAVVGVIIAGGAAAIAKWPHASWWLVVVIVAAAAVMPPALLALPQVSARQLDIGRTARTGLQGTTGPHGSKLPTVATADLEARVKPSVLPIPYIHRDEEETIRTDLHARQPVLLIGSSMVGKTKMAARVIAEEFGPWPVAIPDSKTGLADLDAKDAGLQNSVIWLDAIDRLIGANGITDGALRRLVAAGRGAGAAGGRRRRPGDPVIRARITTVGLGKYVGGTTQVAEALKLGAAGADSLGAIASGDPEAAPGAAVNLGNLLASQDDQLRKKERRSYDQFLLALRTRLRIAELQAFR